MSERNGSGNVDKTLGARANGADLGEERLRLRRERFKIANEYIRKIVTNDFLNRQGMSFDEGDEAENMVQLHDQIAESLVYSGTLFESWDEEQWRSFVIEYLDQESSKALSETLSAGDLETVEQDFRTRIDETTSLVMLEYLENEIRHIKMRRGENSDEESRELLQRVKNSLVDEVKKRYFELCREAYVPHNETAGEFYRHLQEVAERKKKLITRARNIKQILSSEISETLSLGSGSTKKDLRMFIAHEFYSQYREKVSEDIYRWMIEEATRVNEELLEAWREAKKRIRETEEGVEGYFESRREVLKERIESASFDELFQIGRYIPTKEKRVFIKSKEIDKLIEQYKAGKRKITANAKRLEEEMQALWQERMVAVAPEKVEAIRLKIAEKKDWAESEFTDPDKKEKITDEQYQNLIKYLDKLESDASDAVEEKRYLRLRHIYNDAEAATFDTEEKKIERAKPRLTRKGGTRARVKLTRVSKEAEKGTEEKSRQVRIETTDEGEGRGALASEQVTLADFVKALGKKRKFQHSGAEMEVISVSQDQIVYKFKRGKDSGWSGEMKLKATPENIVKFWKDLNEKMGWKKKMPGEVVEATGSHTETRAMQAHEVGVDVREGEGEKEPRAYKELEKEFSKAELKQFGRVVAQGLAPLIDHANSHGMALKKVVEEIVGLSQLVEKIGESIETALPEAWLDAERKLFAREYAAEEIKDSLE